MSSGSNFWASDGWRVSVSSSLIRIANTDTCTNALDEEWRGSSSSRSCSSFTRSLLSQQILPSNPFTLLSLSLGDIPKTSFPLVAPPSLSVNFRNNPILLVRTLCCPRNSTVLLSAFRRPTWRSPLEDHTDGKLRKAPRSLSGIEELSVAVSSSFLLPPSSYYLA